MQDRSVGVSDKLAELRNIVNIQIPATSGRWEVFETPEYRGGVPGPGDYVTLIGELTPSEQYKFDASARPTGKTFVAPESARAWLSEPFRQLLEKNKGTNANMSGQFDCREYTTTLTKSGKPVSGFLCASADRILIYLTLWVSQP